MPSLLARLKLKTKKRSSRQGNGADSYESASSAESLRDTTTRSPASSEGNVAEVPTTRPVDRPPQIPALDFAGGGPPLPIPASGTGPAIRDAQETAPRAQHSAQVAIAQRSANHSEDVDPAVSSPSNANLGASIDAIPIARVSIRDPDTSPSNFLSRQLQGLSLQPQIAPWTDAGIDTPELVKLREAAVQEIAADVRQRRQLQRLTDEGRKVFRAAGMEDTLVLRDTIEVHTRWLPPVIHEHIVRREHTEYLTVIEREIHKYHIYPKIQPVSDPDPIRLEPRHRLFDAVSGKWHEVIGDAAAIAILGEETFRNGPKEERVTRGMALPGFGTVTRMTDAERARYGLDVVDENGAWIDHAPEKTTLSIEI